MNGREKCEMLRRIRQIIAESNGITCCPFVCDHEGECPGTCPQCDMEAAQLLKEIRSKSDCIQSDARILELLNSYAKDHPLDMMPVEHLGGYIPVEDGRF